MRKDKTQLKGTILPKFINIKDEKILIRHISCMILTLFSIILYFYPKSLVFIQLSVRAKKSNAHQNCTKVTSCAS
jgi:hypothetical protein